jgi:hypothetical protein
MNGTSAAGRGMSERRDIPILMSAPMVRATLADMKWQTRRDCFDYAEPPGNCFIESGHAVFTSGCFYEKRKLRWAPGDRLWVRETWAMASRASDFATIYYRASERQSHTEFHKQIPVALCGKIQTSWPKWKPAIHMPRSFSRITLEVTDVRVERLQSISREDAIAEGIYWSETFGGWTSGAGSDETCDFHQRLPEVSYSKLWDRINGRGSWDANPWIVVIGFRRVTA